MLPDLERLVRLQQIDTFLDNARRRIDEHPALVEALEAKLAAANDALTAARQRVAENRTARAAVEKDLAMIQARLGKFRDQLMEVKTNKEYQAIQKEIAGAEHDVRRLEDRVLEKMVEADDLAADVRKAEAGLAADKAAIAKEGTALGQETTQLRVQVEEQTRERAEVVGQVPAMLLGTYDTLIRGRRGLAVVEARDYICTACHVRLRPQVFNEIRRGDTVHQCGSCQRILYFPPVAPAAGADQPPGTAQ